MKKIYITCVLAAIMVVVGTLGAASAGKKEASAAFKTTVHDFGKINENGGPVSCEFPFVNNGTGNLIVFDATAECGCTRPDYPKNPISPSKEGKIKVTYNPIGRPGAFEKTVTVKFNGKPSKVRLKIRGNVIPARSAK